MELKITKERVLDAASKCSTAKATLETLFPEAFKDDKEEEFKKLKHLISDWINYTHGVIYEKIDGGYSGGKAETIIRLIRDKYKI